MDMKEKKIGNGVPLSKDDIDSMWDSYDSLIATIERAERLGMIDERYVARTKHQLQTILQRIQDSV